MGSCFSDDHIAKHYIHTDKTTSNIEEPQQKYRLAKASNRLLGDLNMFYWIQTLALSFCSGSKHLVRMKIS